MWFFPKPPEMQAQSTAVISYRHPVPLYAPASLHAAHRGGRCTSKPLTGKSFTIDALLAKPEEAGGNLGRLTQCSVKYPPAVAHVLPFVRHVGLPVVPAPCVYPSEALQTPLHVHCPAFSCPESCRGAYYSQVASMSKVNAALQSLKAKSGKSKRMRTSFTSEQLARLEKEFARQQYMVGSERFLLASALQLTEAQVKVWFQNRRIKWRKQSLEQQQAKLAKLGLIAPPKSPGSQSHGSRSPGSLSHRSQSPGSQSHRSQGPGDEDNVEEEFSNWDVDMNTSDDLDDRC